MKTPDEIKKGLEMCAIERGPCGCCPYRRDNSSGCIPHKSSDALAYIQQLEAQTSKWISVYDDIPMNEDDVLVLLEGKNADIAWFNGYDGTWHTNGYYSGTVTHWMPLLEPPKEEQHD